MDNDDHLPMEPDEVVTEIASILAGGCFRHLKSRRISLSSEHPSITADVAQVEESEPLTENRLDSSSPKGLHSEAT
ncbi:MAG: hypothetical protein DRP47_10590 [Candidatus Zixiibacteriota bacterium]|nr:MAG: hypothetical protein DRP47_10590 [candidate division Zixibacteria bacterium]